VTQVSETIYLATIRLRTGAGTGTVTFRATGRDLAGATQQTTRAYPLH
jgi:hypothetical protein